MKHLKIGARLTAGFAAVLALLACLVVIGIWRLHEASSLTENLLTKKLKNERAIAEWQRQTDINIVRANALVSIDNPAERKQVAAQMKATSTRISELQEQIAASLEDVAAKSLLADVQEKRKAYLALRTMLFQEKESGNDDAVRRLMTGEMPAKLGAYTDSVGKLFNYEMALIDRIGADLNGLYVTGRRLMLLLGAVALAFGAAFSYWITRSVTRPLGEAVAIARRVAAGDLTSRIDVSARDETGELMRALRDMNDSLDKIVGDVRNGTQTVATASAQIAAGNADLSARTEHQASSLEETASSMEELTSTVRQNADNAREASQLASVASGVAIEGGAVVAKVVQTMTAINDASRKVADIITVIDGIAFQTNILALNAAVEAARAGEQGRGFAVVAAEVRSLAQRSAAAAKEVKSLIDESVVQVGEGSRLVGEAGQTMNQIVASVRRVSDVMGDILSASQEQSAGIEQVNQAIGQMDQVTQQNASLVEQAANAAQALQAEAGRLSDAVAVFRLAGGAAQTPHGEPCNEEQRRPRLSGASATPQSLTG